MNDSSASLSDQLGSYIRHATGAPAAVRIHKKYVGGFSWRTWGFTLTTSAGDEELILRLGHAEGLLSPYSAVPEFLVLSSLASSAVPLPRVRWHSDDPSWLGAPFLVVDKVEGTVNTPFGKKTEEALAADRHIGEQFVDVLVELHNFDWQSTAARDLPPAATAQTAAAVQIAKWERMIRDSRTRPLPLLHHAIGWLKRNQPEAPRLCIVHGDYRSGNFLQNETSITAVLDWELVHLGDPHEDIAWASMRFLGGGSELVSGLIERDRFMARYQAGTGIAISQHSLRFYEVLSLVKICAINLQAAARVEDGSAPDVRMTTLGFGLPRLQLEMNRIIAENP